MQSLCSTGLSLCPFMNRLILILTGFYFLLGNILLPQGDFSALAQLPAMYHHCKSVEDPDMNVADFITEHLLNMEDSDEADENDKHELPHNPVPFQNTSTHIFYCIVEPASFSFETARPVTQNKVAYNNPYFPRLGLNEIFQPPRV